MREQRRRHPPVPPARLNKEAGERPDLVRIPTGQRARPVQPRKIPPRPEGNPADRLLPRERNRTPRPARGHQRLHPPLRRPAFNVLPALALLKAPVHTPATPTGPTRSEQRLERRPQVRRQIPHSQFLLQRLQPKEILIISSPARPLPTAASSDRMRARHAPVAQLDRVPGYEPGGREFESLRARQSDEKGTPTVGPLFYWIGAPGKDANSHAKPCRVRRGARSAPKDVAAQRRRSRAQRGTSGRSPRAISPGAPESSRNSRRPECSRRRAPVHFRALHSALVERLLIRTIRASDVIFPAAQAAGRQPSGFPE